jgi:hypothetical protein
MPLLRGEARLPGHKAPRMRVYSVAPARPVEWDNCTFSRPFYHRSANKNGGEAA